MSYIGNSPGVASQRVTTTLTATAAQTQFTTQSGYVLGYVDVYLNGAKLVNGADFEAITGTYITLFSGAAAGDVIELISYVPRGLSDGYTKAEADSKFLDVGGDTATGNLAFATATLSGNLTLNGGTANGVGYLNASKVVVAGSALTFDGTILAAPTLNLTNALGIAYGGTGQTTANAALNALLPAQTGNATKYLQTDGTNTTWDAISISTADITGTLPVANGGTGATTAAGALTSLGAYAASNPSGYTTNLGTVTSVGGTGTVNGLTLTGTVSTTGNLTLGGTLSLVSPPAIGSTTPNTGAFTSLSATGLISTTKAADGSNGSINLGVAGSANGEIRFFNGSTATGQATVGFSNGAGAGDFLIGSGGGSGTIRFVTGSGEALKILSNLNVGIGTSLPAQKLQVEQNSANPAVRIVRTGYGYTDLIGGTGGSGNDFKINMNGTDRLYIESSTGNIGIGTPTPAVKLDIAGAGTAVTQLIWARGNADAAFVSSLRTGDAGTSAYQSTIGVDYAGFTDFSRIKFYRASTLGEIHFFTGGLSGNGTEQMRLTSSALLVGNTTTNTNSSKLVVNGTISQTVGSTQYLVVDQSDVGTAPNQIPLNQYLGSMAFQDRENVNFTGGTGALSSLDIAAISAQLNVSATDVFVYDTSKDSDGGAWRKRCQHTSWYNETLNTQTRGARREFPAVAVIVATATSLTIYDGDSPDLPMWMVFNQGGSWPSNNIIGQTSSGSLTAVAALNAIITVSVASDAVRLINFVSEETRFPWPGSPRIYFSNIQNRNSSSGWRNGTFGTIGTIASNDVAMTVLPNAAIDSATGLPIPIVAVATNGGVSLIKDTGTVTTVTAAAWDPSPKGAQQVMFSGEYILFTGQEYAYYQMDWYIDKINNFGRFADTASYDSAQNQIASSGDGSSIAGFQLGNVGYQSGSIYAVSTAAGNGQFYYGRGLDSSANGGLYLMSPNYADMPKSMVAHIGKTYNSGWQVGLSKGAWLSDTTQETIIGTGNLAGWSTASNWIKQPSISLSWTGSAISITGNGTGSSVYFMLPITVVPNTNYTFTISFTAWNAVSPVLNVNQYAMSGVLVNIGTSTPGTYTFSFNSGSNTTVYLQSYQVSTTASVITNFDLRKSELDRSVYPKGLFIAGTLNKTPVAANADLVGYSGFTANNYLTQPYNSSLDFGTGDFSVSTWINPNNQGSIGGIHLVFNGAASGLTGTAFGILGGSSGRIDLVIGGVQHSNETIVDPGDIWQHLVVTRRSGVFYCYVNGILKFTNSNVVNLTGIVTQLYIGGYFYSGNFTAVNNKFALLRMSATAPSVDQIRKMYNDEKHLFQENAKAALYGTSDAVTAVAYDEHTQLLHAGTSSGRSVFDGLRRVDNTTTAVATAISAADGLVVEN